MFFNKSNRLARGLSICGAFFMFSMVALSFVDVVGRYFLNSPLKGAGEIIAFFMGLVVFIAFPLVTSDQEHICVGLFERHFKGNFRYFQRLFVLLGSLAMVGFYVLLMFTQAESMRKWKILTSELDLPKAPMVYLFCILTAIAFFMFLPVVWRYLRDGNDPDKEESGTKKGAH